jgi:hypothetical protein
MTPLRVLVDYQTSDVTQLLRALRGIGGILGLQGGRQEKGCGACAP